MNTQSFQIFPHPTHIYTTVHIHEYSSNLIHMYISNYTCKGEVHISKHYTTLIYTIIHMYTTKHFIMHIQLKYAHTFPVHYTLYTYYIHAHVYTVTPLEKEKSKPKKLEIKNYLLFKYFS